MGNVISDIKPIFGQSLGVSAGSMVCNQFAELAADAGYGVVKVRVLRSL